MSGRGSGGGNDPQRPALLGVLSRLRSQQRREGGSGSTAGASAPGAVSSDHVAVPIRPERGSGSGSASGPGVTGDGSWQGDSLSASEAGHVSEALREHRAATADIAEPRGRQRHLQGRRREGSRPDEAAEVAFNAAIESHAEAPEDSAEESMTRHGDLNGMAETAHDNGGGPIGDSGVAGGTASGAGGGAAAKQPTLTTPEGRRALEEWSDQHISELYKASLAREVNVSRDVWNRYTDPARQRRRKERGLPPSVMIGTITQEMKPFRNIRRRHEQRRQLSLAASKSMGARDKAARLMDRWLMMYPTSPLPVLISIAVTFMDCTYSAFFIPITTVFNISLTSWNWVTIPDFVAAIIFTADILLLEFSTGLVIVNNLRQAVVQDHRLVAMHYIFRGTFVIDVLATAPLWVEVFVVATAGRHASQGVLNVLNVLRCFRLLRLIRVAKVAIRQSFMPTAIRWLPHALSYFINLSFTAALFINLMGCLWYYVARVEDIGSGDTWLSFVGANNADLADRPEVEQYVAAIYWATTTITTVGYGDVTPTTTAERVVAMIVMLIGAAFFGFLIGAVGEFLEHASANAQRGRLFRAKMENVDRWMEARNLPSHMRQEITAYYSDIWTRHTAYHDNDFFTDLPAALRGKVARYRTRPAVANSALGQALGPRALLVLSTVILPCDLQPGHDLCQQGQAADRIWLLSEGSVLAIAHGRSMARITAPAVLGEAALLAALTDTPAVRPLTYRASVSCSLWELAVEDILRMRVLQPTIIDDLAAHFVQAAERSLATMDPANLQRLFPGFDSREEVVTELEAELLPPDDRQTVAAEVIAALDVDLEALDSRRDIVMPSLEKVREILEGEQKSRVKPPSFRSIGRSVLNGMRLSHGASDEAEASVGPLPSASAFEGAPAAQSESHGAGNRSPSARPGRFGALQQLDSRAPVDPERMSLAEAAAWTWHAGADHEAQRAEVRAAAARRVTVTLAATRARTASEASPGASQATRGGGGGGNSDRFADLVLQARQARSHPGDARPAGGDDPLRRREMADEAAAEADALSEAEEEAEAAAESWADTGGGPAAARRGAGGDDSGSGGGGGPAGGAGLSQGSPRRQHSRRPVPDPDSSPPQLRQQGRRAADPHRPPLPWPPGGSPDGRASLGAGGGGPAAAAGRSAGVAGLPPPPPPLPLPPVSVLQERAEAEIIEEARRQEARDPLLHAWPEHAPGDAARPQPAGQGAADAEQAMAAADDAAVPGEQQLPGARSGRLQD